MVRLHRHRYHHHLLSPLAYPSHPCRCETTPPFIISDATTTRQDPPIFGGMRPHREMTPTRFRAPTNNTLISNVISVKNLHVKAIAITCTLKYWSVVRMRWQRSAVSTPFSTFRKRPLLLQFRMLAARPLRKRPPRSAHATNHTQNTNKHPHNRLKRTFSSRFSLVSYTTSKSKGFGSVRCMAEIHELSYNSYSLN